jgi:hypothetical protein
MAGLVKEPHYDAQPAWPTAGARGLPTLELVARWRATKEANLAGCRQSAIDAAL